MTIIFIMVAFVYSNYTDIVLGYVTIMFIIFKTVHKI